MGGSRRKEPGGDRLLLQVYRMSSSSSFQLYRESPVRWPAGVCSAATAMDPDEWLEVGAGMCLGWQISLGGAAPLFDKISDSENCVAPRHNTSRRYCYFC